MKIAIVTPAAAGSRTGNRHTAQRWATMLRAAGHKVSVATEWNATPADVLFALHARRSHPSVLRYRQAYSEGNLVVVLTGTDLYRDIRYDTAAQLSLKLAQRLVVLQEEGLKELPRQFRAKTRVVYQSAQVKTRAIPPKKTFRVCVLGHLREEKDPFRAALALNLIPPEEPVELVHLGKALSPLLAAQAQALMAQDPRYRWLGGQPHWRALRWLGRSHLMVISSRMEGGANAIAEAACAGVPVLASAIPGNIGMLGSGYPGYYPLGDEKALARLL
ncbi:MAG: TIGR04348 family glycosyltransferase, partial [Betaproteobacteria bacterium]|nr:TIGR04348 family glycosyltransferase [Betaproteobacteria bacterium]